MGTAVIEQVEELKMRIHFVKEGQQHHPQEEVGEEEEDIIPNNEDVHVVVPVPEGHAVEGSLEVLEPSTELVQVKEEVIEQSSNELGQEEEGENGEELKEEAVVKSESIVDVDLSSVIDDILNMSEEPQKFLKKGRTRDGGSSECEVCGKIFAVRWNLVAHMRIHTDERPFRCPVCSNGFRQYAHLSKHVRGYPSNAQKDGIYEHNMAANHNHLSSAVGSNMRGLHPGIRQPSPQRIKVDNISIVGKCLPPRLRPAHVKKKVIPAQVKKFSPAYVKKFSPAYIKKFIHAVPVEPENPYKNFKLRKCEVRVNRFDVDDDKPVSTSLILQKFNHMASRTQGQDLLLQLNAEGRSCVVKMDTNLLAHFLQPIFPPPPSSSAGFVRVNLNRNVNQTSTSVEERVKKPEPITKTVLQPVIAREGRGRPPKGSLLFKCTKCTKRCISQSTLVMHDLRYHSGNSGNRFGFPKNKKVDVSNNTSVSGCNKTSTSLTMSMNKFEEKIQTASVKVQNGQISQVQDKKIHRVGSLGCSICSRTFSRLDVLKKHMQLHTREGERSSKSFHCPTCLKSFVSSSYLVYHMRTHTGERPYECQQCKKRFTRSDTLKNHMRLHTGERPYACPKCEDRFVQFSRLQIHIKKYHSDETACYKCAVCLASFFDEASLTDHSAFH